MDRSVGTGELREARSRNKREVARVREMISNKQQHIPVTELIGHINRHLRGWKAYYDSPRRCDVVTFRPTSLSQMTTPLLSGSPQRKFLCLR